MNGKTLARPAGEERGALSRWARRPGADPAGPGKRTMRRLAWTFPMTLFASAALAQSAPMTQAIACGEAQGLVAARGMVLLYTSPRTWDQFVAHQGFCVTMTELRTVWVRTRDTPECPLQVCAPRPPLR